MTTHKLIKEEQNNRAVETPRKQQFILNIFHIQLSCAFPRHVTIATAIQQTRHTPAWKRG